MLTPLNRVRCLDDRGAEVGKADRFQSHKIVEMKSIETRRLGAVIFQCECDSHGCKGCCCCCCSGSLATYWLLSQRCRIWRLSSCLNSMLLRSLPNYEYDSQSRLRNWLSPPLTRCCSLYIPPLANCRSFSNSVLAGVSSILILIVVIATTLDIRLSFHLYDLSALVDLRATNLSALAQHIPHSLSRVRSCSVSDFATAAQLTPSGS